MARERRHEQLPRSLDEQVVGQETRWLKFGDMKGETGSRIAAAQDQACSIDCLKSRLSKEEIGSKCQLCNQREETVDLTSGCPILAKNEYLMRHDKVSSCLQY